MPDTFQAWSHSTPPFGSSLKLVDVTAPESLGPTEILVETVAAALNPVDVQLANLPIFRLAALSYPKGMAADFSGRILARGSDVKLDVGDEVFGMTFQAMPKPIDGCLSQVIHMDSKAAQVMKKPASMSFVQAASLPLVFQTAMTCLSPPYTYTSSQIDPSPSIVILGGSSSVGIYAVQYAKSRLGARVIATCSTSKADFVRSLGADTVVDYTRETVAERLQELRPDGGFLAIIDCVGGTELLPHLSSLLAPRSRTLPCGGNFTSIVGDKTDRSRMGGGTTLWWNPRMAWRSFVGYIGWGPRYATIDLVGGVDKLEAACALFEEGKLQVPIDSEWPFDKVKEAYDRLNSGRSRGKVVVKVREHRSAAT